MLAMTIANDDSIDRNDVVNRRRDGLSRPNHDDTSDVNRTTV